MSRVALVTAEIARDADDDETPLLDALIWSGVDASVVVWDDRKVDWSTFDLVVVRSTWDYALRHNEFVRWIRRVSLRATLVNSADVIEWNLDKRYLRDLQLSAIPVVPTTWIEPGDAIRLPDRGELVVKPVVSAGAKDTTRYVMPNHADVAREHIESLLRAKRPVMMQPYISSVDEVGETALVYIDGTFSHAVRKGSILTEPLLTTTALFAAEDLTPTEATAAERELGDAVLRLVSEREPVLYARVDIVQGARGEPLVLEVELTEPSLFLSLHEGATDRFAEAIGRWASR
ncbi:unannotated protein [freshwater metagenome]|uniref:Unannotated protein n=1 Tax=freshwater metagenome TaxID=449393 RepID=A0A6J6VWC3_9ZZZZ|nr:hypothetical protein [Actinomycetota bacterium]MSW91369.1 hypothetical protein [Actinomycetota bacterium]MSY73585.1 hypothetical protein [Actinomycetota bacterium]